MIGSAVSQIFPILEEARPVSTVASEAQPPRAFPTAHAARESLGAAVAKSLTRMMLGWFLLHQGWGKVVQEWTEGPGSFQQGRQYQNNSPDWLPELVAVPYGYALPWLELGFGTLLLLGLWNRVSAGACTLILLSILVAWLNAGNLLPRHMLMIYAPLAAWYFFTGPGRFSLDAMLAKRKEVV